MNPTVIENMIICLYFLAAFGLILLANFLYDVWKNSKRDYVGEIRRGELAIENDDVWALRACCDYIWPEGLHAHGIMPYYIQHSMSSEHWAYIHTTTLPTIKASELVKHLNK